MRAAAAAAVVATTLAALAAAAFARAPAERAWVPTATKAGFAVRYKGAESRYRVNAVMVLPGQALDIAVVGQPDAYAVRAAGGTVLRRTTATWTWTAPSRPGVYPIGIVAPAQADSLALHAFVLVPRQHKKGEYLGGYRIGRYPPVLAGRSGITTPPAGFIEVTPEIEGMLVSPRFRLEQFLCKQESGYPKYVVLDERLLLKLEELLDRVNAAGIRATSFHVMSGYRTPYYNRRIGNVSYSRHLWGAAADVFIDESPRDGEMDDLNGDGVVDTRDAEVLRRVFEGASEEPGFAPLRGGLAKYRRTATHGPFVHVDVRGYRARW